MKRRHAMGRLLAAGAVSLLGRAEDFTLRSESRLVILDVSVRDHKGALISGLDKNNFQIFENGKAQAIRSFATTDQPVTVGLVIDESFSMQPRINEVAAAANQFITSSNPHDEVFVLNFNDTVRRGLPEGVLFSSNREQLRKALYSGRPMGKTALYDALIQGLDQLTRGRHERKTLVLISDGGDNASHHNRKEALERVETAPATVYTIGVFDPDDPDRVPGLLREIASISGGDCFLPRDLSEVMPACTRIAADIRARYTLTYIPPGGRAGEVRHIRVHVTGTDRHDLTARTRETYRFGEER
jgi:Ca-activated chloride channel family protein